MFDVGGLLEDAETKNAALEKVEELEEHLSHVRDTLPLTGEPGRPADPPVLPAAFCLGSFQPRGVHSSEFILFNVLNIAVAPKCYPLPNTLAVVLLDLKYHKSSSISGY